MPGRRAAVPSHVWSYDLVQDRTTDGRVYQLGDERSPPWPRCDHHLVGRPVESP